VRIKVFRRDETIVWSDEPRLIGTAFTTHREHLAQAMAGETRAVFEPPQRAMLNAIEDLPRARLIEFYVPLYLGGLEASARHRKAYWRCTDSPMSWTARSTARCSCYGPSVVWVDSFSIWHCSSW